MERTYWRDRHHESLALARRATTVPGKLAQLELARLYQLKAGPRDPFTTSATTTAKAGADIVECAGISTNAKVSYLVTLLAVAACVTAIVDKGFAAAEYAPVGALLVIATALVILGSDDKGAPAA